MNSPSNKRSSWYKNSEMLGHYKTLVESLLNNEQLAQSDFVSVGQSPAWVCFIAEPSLRKRGDEVKYIPFSKSKDYTFHGNIVSKSASELVVEFPDAKYEDRYRDTLSKLGVSPSSIIARHKEGKKTTFLDAVDSERGLSQFMYILSKWAVEEGCFDDFKDSINMVMISGFPNKRESVVFPQIDVSLDVIVEQSELGRTLQYSAKREQRLVPKYPMEKWNKAVPNLNFMWARKAIKENLITLGNEIAEGEKGKPYN